MFLSLRIVVLNVNGIISFKKKIQILGHTPQTFFFVLKVKFLVYYAQYMKIWRSTINFFWEVSKYLK